MRGNEWLESDATVLLLIFGAFSLGMLLLLASAYFA